MAFLLLFNTQVGALAGWVLSYKDAEKNLAPEIPDEYKEMPRTRQDAKATGAAYYFTGISCTNGHIAPRKTKGACVECTKEASKAVLASRAEYFAYRP